MGVANVFYRVPAAKLTQEVLPAFRRAIEERSIAPLLPYLDRGRVRAELFQEPTVELRTRGLFKKRTVVRFLPSPGVLLGAALTRDEEGCDVDKLLHQLRPRTELLSDEDWERLDELLDWGHNLPDVFRDDEGPYGFVSPEELPELVQILERLGARLTGDDRVDLQRLCEYLAAAAPTDGVLVYTG